jgi:hypothetical protein
MFIDSKTDKTGEFYEISFMSTLEGNDFVLLGKPSPDCRSLVRMKLFRGRGFTIHNFHGFLIQGGTWLKFGPKASFLASKILLVSHFLTSSGRLLFSITLFSSMYAWYEVPSLPVLQ